METKLHECLQDVRSQLLTEYGNASATEPRTNIQKVVYTTEHFQGITMMELRVDDAYTVERRTYQWTRTLLERCPKGDNREAWCRRNGRSNCTHCIWTEVRNYSVLDPVYIYDVTADELCTYASTPPHWLCVSLFIICKSQRKARGRKQYRYGGRGVDLLRCRYGRGEQRMRWKKKIW